METPKMVGVFVVKRYAVREAKKVRNAKTGRYAVRKGEGVSPSSFHPCIV